MKTWLQPSTNPTIYHLIQICHSFLSYFLSFFYSYQEHLTATVSRSNHLSSNTNKSLFLSYFLSLFYLHIRNTWLQPSPVPTIYHLKQICHFFILIFIFMLSSDQEHLTATVPRSNHLSAITDPTFSYSLLSYIYTSFVCLYISAPVFNFLQAVYCTV